MSDRAPWPVITAYESDFYVFDFSDNPVTGLVNANFTKQLAKDGAHSAVAVTVAEVDAANQPGRYKATYTPDATGYWSLRIAHATHNKRGWQDDLQVYSEEVLSGTRQTADVADVKKLVEADLVLEKPAGGGGWKVHVYERGTTADLIPAKRLLDENGAAVTAALTPVASQQE